MEQQTPQTAVRTETRAGEALSVRRLFTRPGTHPFETVEWELRDARIGTVFEQPDVEFPKTWSQNATNIVAQKYFRGQSAGFNALVWFNIGFEEPTPSVQPGRSRSAARRGESSR